MTSAFATPYSPRWAEPYSSRGTFCGVPARPVDAVQPGEVVIIGAPFDWGTSYRPGCRFGPRAIRDADYLEPDGRRPHLDAELDPLQVLPVVDAGDVPMVRGYIERSLAEIERYVHEIVSRGAVPVVLGGDHSITWPNATAVARHYGFGSIGVVHFDAHADTGEYDPPELMGHGAPMRRLIESGAVPGHRFVQVGLRGYWPPPETLQWMRDQQMRSYMMSDIVLRGLGPVLDEALDRASDRTRGDVNGIFLSIDIDVVDPSAAPGTGTPEPGGLTSAQLLTAVRRVASSLPIVAVDVVEVSPAYDQPMNITAMLANRVVLEVLTGMAERRRAHEAGSG